MTRYMNRCKQCHAIAVMDEISFSWVCPDCQKKNKIKAAIEKKLSSNTWTECNSTNYVFKVPKNTKVNH